MLLTWSLASIIFFQNLDVGRCYDKAGSFFKTNVTCLILALKNPISLEHAPPPAFLSWLLAHSALLLGVQSSLSHLFYASTAASCQL